MPTSDLSQSFSSNYGIHQPEIWEILGKVDEGVKPEDLRSFQSSELRRMTLNPFPLLSPHSFALPSCSGSEVVVVKDGKVRQ